MGMPSEIEKTAGEIEINLLDACSFGAGRCREFRRYLGATLTQ